MNSVIYLKAMTDPSVAPCFVLVDLQMEYMAGDRLMAMPETSSVLANCRSALAHARAMGFPVAYVRQKSRSSFFNPSTTFFSWISGFEPTSADMVFDRDKPSCYSNRNFSELMEGSGGHFVLAGFAGETACLSTAVDAYHRNHRFTYLADASASHGLGRLSADHVQEAITEIIGTYGDILDTRSWITTTSNCAALPSGDRNER
jgi:nicotinamidase-related amidase